MLNNVPLMSDRDKFVGTVLTTVIEVILNLRFFERNIRSCIVVQKLRVDGTQNDERAILLDSENGTIKFLTNNKDHNIGHENIKHDENIKYRLFVSLYDVNDAVQLVNFCRK